SPAPCRPWWTSSWTLRGDLSAFILGLLGFGVEWAGGAAPEVWISGGRPTPHRLRIPAHALLWAVFRPAADATVERRRAGPRRSPWRGGCRARQAFCMDNPPAPRLLGRIMEQPESKRTSPLSLLVDAVLVFAFFLYMYSVVSTHVPSKDHRMVLLWGAACS